MLRIRDYRVEGFQKVGYLCGGPNNKEQSILGFILACPYFGLEGGFIRDSIGDYYRAYEGGY